MSRQLPKIGLIIMQTCSKMKDVGIVITKLIVIVNFEYCLLLDTIPAENMNTVNETE